jgi:D-amino-acid dehydrogenase
MKIAIIGAGITGLTSAYILARKNHEVEVFETKEGPALDCSFANGGQISVSNSEVWYTWGNLYKASKWMFTKDAPLLMPLRADLEQWKWLSKFLWHTLKGDHLKNTEKTIIMAKHSRDLYEKLIKEESIEFDQRFEGILHVYNDFKAYKKAQRLEEVFTKNGVEWLSLTHEIKNRPESYANMAEVFFKDANDFNYSIFTKSDWTGDIHLFCVKLAEILKEKYGVKFNYNMGANPAILRDTFDRIVVSAGVGSKKIARYFGDNLPIYPVKGYSITINNVPNELLPKTSLLDDEAKIVTSSFNNRFRVAGTAEFAGENRDVNEERIKPLLKWVNRNFPKIDTKDYSGYACLRPMTPNMLPIVGRSRNYNKVIYNTGHGHLGWTLAMETARQTGELL